MQAVQAGVNQTLLKKKKSDAGCGVALPGLPSLVDYSVSDCDFIC